MCPDCLELISGGETSDFGSPVETPPPDPCNAGRTSSPIDAAGADALGFGAGLAALAPSFDLPLEWSLEDVKTYGDPSSGYARATRLSGSIRVASIEHVVSPVQGCSDALALSLDATFETADGALSIQGPLEAKLTRDKPFPRALGRLDLSKARGTLQLDLALYDHWVSFPGLPPPRYEGILDVLLQFWPEGVRSQLEIIVIPKGSGFDFRPLVGQAPADGCRFDQRPLGPDDPGVSPDGASMREVQQQLQAMLAGIGPFAVPGASGASTSLSVQLGEPSLVCSTGSTNYSTPLRLTTEDGRIHVDHMAQAQVDFAADGAVRSALWSISEPGAAIPREAFEQQTGISGIDFGAARAATWYAELQLSTDPAPRVHGELGVTGVDPGSGNSTGELFSLDW